MSGTLCIISLEDMNLFSDLLILSLYSASQVFETFTLEYLQIHVALSSILSLHKRKKKKKKKKRLSNMQVKSSKPKQVLSDPKFN